MMKHKYLLLLSLSLPFEACGQVQQNEFNYLLKDIINNQVPDSISDQMKTKSCSVIILNNDAVEKFKETSPIDQVCILTEEEIFLENPKFYIEF